MLYQDHIGTNKLFTPLMIVDSEIAANGRMRRKTLIKMRWLAIMGQIAALFCARYVFGMPLPLLAPSAVILASLIFNMIAMRRGRNKPYLHNKGATFALSFDALQMAALLFFTGGFTNPFVILLFAPITIAATVLSGRSVVFMAALILVGFWLLLYAAPLPWPAPQQFSPLFHAGMICATLLTGAFLVLYIRRVARETRRLNEALTSSRMALEHEQKISALGALAAAVAHELGSPLSTIAIVVKEMEEELKASPHAEDMALLQSEVQRCRTILSDYSKHNVLSDRAVETCKAKEFLLRVLEPYRRDALKIILIAHGKGAEPLWPLSPGLMHGVGNILHNACQFARAEVRIMLEWNDQAATLVVEDDGPGFPVETLPKLGLAYVSSRPRGGASGMGLGLFIAKTLLERSGATLSFTNQEEGGARVTIKWDFLPQ